LKECDQWIRTRREGQEKRGQEAYGRKETGLIF